MPRGSVDLRWASPGSVATLFERIDTGDEPVRRELPTPLRESVVRGRFEAERDLLWVPWEVEVERTRASPLLLSSLAVRPLSTDERGEFALGELGPGTGALLAIGTDDDLQLLARVRIREPGETIDLGRVGGKAGHPFELTVEPAFSPEGENWRLELLPTLERAGELRVLDAGYWSGELGPGRWLIRLLDPAGSVVALREIETPATDSLTLALETVLVRGAVSGPGSETIEALVFGTLQGAESVRAEVDEGGTFEAVLPRAGSWPIEALRSTGGDCPRCGDAELFQALEPVELSADSSGTAWLDLVLPDTRLYGRVVGRSKQSRDRAPAAARISIGRTDEERRRREAAVIAREDGRFELLGLSPGALVLQASDGSGRESSWVEVELEEGEDAEVELELIEAAPMHLRVLSPWGPLAGASVALLPQATSAGAVPFAARRGQTAGDGVATLSYPDVAREGIAVVSQAGFGTALRRLILAPEREAIVRLSPAAGTLRLPFEKRVVLAGWLRTDTAGPIRLDELRFLLGSDAEITPEGVFLRSLEPGFYELCVEPEAKDGDRPSCVSGVVAAGEELPLQPD